MPFRTDHIQFFQGRQHFAIRRDTEYGEVRFLGLLNGRVCGRWDTKEAAVQALLRRAAFFKFIQDRT